MIYAEDITDKWHLGALERSNIFDYLREQIVPQTDYTIIESDLEHIVDMCFSLYQYSRFGKPVGDFLTAIVKDSWSEACQRADECNRQWGWMINSFLYNCAPYDWREQHDLVNKIANPQEI